MQSLSAVLGVVALLVTTGPPLTAQDTAATVARGAEIYGATCGRCHTARSPLERTDREWVTIANHMRVRANLTGKQTRAVLAFLQATNTDPREVRALTAEEGARGEAGDPDRPVSTDPALIATGANLVSQNACLGCHVVGRAGGNVGPSLNGVVRRLGPGPVRRKLTDPTYNNTTSMMPNFGLTDRQVEAITAYLASRGGP